MGRNSKIVDCTFLFELSHRVGVVCLLFLFSLSQRNKGADVAVPRCVIAQELHRTYDLNSWAETPQSRAKVASLPKMLPLFEGYDSSDTDPNRYTVGGHNAKLGECRWQQTANCDPKGTREWENDLNCDQEVGSGASGYCRCADGSMAGL